MLKILTYLFLILAGMLVGLIAAFVLTQTFVGSTRDYYVPIAISMLLAMLLVPIGGLVGGYLAKSFYTAIAEQQLAPQHTNTLPEKPMRLGLIFTSSLPETEELWESECRVIAQQMAKLDERCEQLNVQPLSSFLGDPDSLEFEEDDFDTPAEESPDRSEHRNIAYPFHESPKLLATVNALLADLSSTDMQETWNSETLTQLRQELQQLERVVHVATTAEADCMLFTF
jgi:signal transduction histidine kinase